MPVIGLLGDASWRWGWLAVPFAASALALVAVVRHRVDERPHPAAGSWRLVAEDRRVAGWALSELFAWSAWAGALVYAGALFVESYGVSAGTAGLLLGGAAVAYLPGNMAARRHVEGSAVRLLVATAPIAAALVALFGVYRPAVGFSAIVLAALATVSAARTIAGSAYGLQVCAEHRVFAMRIRTAANQFGYLLGSAIGGLALAFGGYGALGASFAVLFVLAAVPYGIALLRAAPRAGG
jgi:predicted MFS family arabinose efflux permease